MEVAWGEKRLLLKRGAFGLYPSTPISKLGKLLPARPSTSELPTLKWGLKGKCISEDNTNQRKDFDVVRSFQKLVFRYFGLSMDSEI